MSSGFISEADIAERKRIKKEQWQNTRHEDDPIEPPEEEEVVPDHRCLYDRLQEQKDKKQDEWDEVHKLKNMVRGLEDDEVDFLELVDNSKLQAERRIRQEETSAMKEYRKKVSEINKKIIESDPLAELKSDIVHKKSNTNQGRKSQLSLMAGAIKRKNTEIDDCIKVAKTEDSTIPSTTSASCEKRTAMKSLQCVAVLPGLGVYTDSSDSENESDSDSDILPSTPRGMIRDLTGRCIQLSGDDPDCY